jgi:hypothetical protein
MNFPISAAGVLAMGFVILFILLAQAGLRIFHKLMGRKLQPQNNEVAGIIFGGVTLIYSLILTFVIVSVWQHYEDLNKLIRNETGKINGIVVHSMSLPDRLRVPIDNALSSYCSQVIDKEWSMDEANVRERPCAIPSLRLMLMKEEPKDREQQAIFSVIAEDLSSITELQRIRSDHNYSQIPDIVWLILVAGSLMLIIFSYFFYVPSLHLKKIYLFFLSGCIGMCMLLVYTLDHPFSGMAKVSSKPYNEILTELKIPIINNNQTKFYDNRSTKGCGMYHSS